MIEHEEDECFLPEAVHVGIPLARPGRELATREAMWKARAAVEASKAAIEAAECQLACLELEALFENYPGIGSVKFHDDNGMSMFYGSATLGRLPKWRGPDHEAHVAKELCLTLAQWLDELAGKAFSWSEEGAGTQTLGQALMGGPGYAAWMAARERAELGVVLPAEDAKSANAPRL